MPYDSSQCDISVFFSMKGVIDRYKNTAKEEPPGSLEVNKVHFGQ